MQTFDIKPCTQQNCGYHVQPHIGETQPHRARYEQRGKRCAVNYIAHSGDGEHAPPFGLYGEKDQAAEHVKQVVYHAACNAAGKAYYKNFNRRKHYYSPKAAPRRRLYRAAAESAT